MTRRLGFEQWVAIAVALLVVGVILGASSASLARGGYSADALAPTASPTVTLPGTATTATHADASRTVAGENEPSVAPASSGSKATTTSAPGAAAATTTTTAPATTTTKAPATTTTAPATTTTTTSTTTAPATTTSTTTTTTTSTTTAPPPPPPPSIQYYAGNTADFCARLSGVRTGAGKPALASCGQTSALQSVALQFAKAKSVWHVGTNEIVGYTYKEMSGLVANFKASSAHYAIITNGTSGVTAKVGCYYREDPADLGARYIFCIAQFTY